MKTIIIAGGGYTGLSAFFQLLKLSRTLNEHQIQVKLIDKARQHHFANPSTNHYLKQLLKPHPHFHFINSEITAFNPNQNSITLQNGNLETYDSLALTIGSETNFFELPGIEQNSYTYKTRSDATNIYTSLEQKLKQHFTSNPTTQFNLIIGGGGFTGVELACELKLHLKHLFKHNSNQFNLINLIVLQAIPELIGLGPKVHNLTAKRFNELNIKFQTNAKIIKFQSPNLIYEDQTTSTIREQPLDFLIWTAGIKPKPFLKTIFENFHPFQGIPVNSTFQSNQFPNLFAAGDTAQIPNILTPNKFIAKTGQMAVQEGKVLGKNLYNHLTSNPLIDFKPNFKGFIIQTGGTHAIFSKGNHAFSGKIPFIIRKIVDLNYYLSILPPISAIKQWKNNLNIFLQND